MATEIKIQRDENIHVIAMGNEKIFTKWAKRDFELMEWLSEVQKFYGKKQKNSLVVGLSAEKSYKYANGKDLWYRGIYISIMILGITILYSRYNTVWFGLVWLGLVRNFGSLVNRYIRKIYGRTTYELLQLCVGNHCLLWETDNGLNTNRRTDKMITTLDQPKPFKDFFYSSQTTIVGVGFKALVGKLENSTNLLVTNSVELNDLAEKKLGASSKGQFRKQMVESLAKLVLGDEVMEHGGQIVIVVSSVMMWLSMLALSLLLK